MKQDLPFSAKKAQIVSTTTGELFLPTRLVYTVRNARQLKARFKKLRSMSWDKSGRRWTWDYCFEALEIDFPEEYSKLPPEYQPIVLASCHLISPSRLHVYLRSTTRLLHFLPFFDKYFPHTCAKAKFLDEYNRITMASPGDRMPIPQDCFKNEERMEVVDFDSSLHRPAEEVIFAELIRKPMDLFYEDGVEHLASAMQFREIMAMEQHKTGKPVKPHELILKLLQDGKM